MKKERFFTILGNNEIRCELCPHNCLLKEGQVGVCGVRKNENGTIVVLNYGKFVSFAVDPIEKKPFFHFYPGSNILSVASYGCNFKCKWCQNWEISQKIPSSLKYIAPLELVDIIIREGFNSIAFTYSEPLMWYEYIYDFAVEIKRKLLAFSILLISNGFINKKPLEKIAKFLDAVNIDIKGMKEKIYKAYIGGSVAPVLDNLKILYENGVHIEITDLLITGLNDDKDDVLKLSNWIATELSPDIPLHLSRYFPAYLMDNPPTPISSLQDAYKVAKKFLKYVYVGNVHLQDLENTYCPNCGTLLIERKGYQTSVLNVKDGKCIKCGEKIYGRW